MQKISSTKSVTTRTWVSNTHCGPVVNRVISKYNTPSGRIFFLRLLVTVSLLGAAAVCGYISYHTLSQNEKKFAVSQYDSISTQALTVMLGSFSRMNEGAATMSKAYRYAFPDETMWPYVTISGFYDTGASLAKVSAIDNLIFAPLVYAPAQRNNFSAFMLKYWATEPEIDLSFSPAAALRGIYTTDPTSPTFFAPDFDGLVTRYNSPNQGLMSVPIQMTFSADLTAAQLGYNSHTDPLFGEPLDFQVACVKAAVNYTMARNKCGFFSNTIPLPVPNPMNPDPPPTNMQAFIFQPIVLERVLPGGGSEGVLVGTTSGGVNWKTLLSKAVPSYVNGIDCVVSTGTSSFTYALVNGEPMFQGVGDKHDRTYSGYAQSVNLLQDAEVESYNSYQLTFYPRHSFFETYKSDAPLFTMIGAICIILFCCVVFGIYDSSISREANRKEVILETKRRFVRFISHEIRTPMNTVRLGLKLLEMEMEGMAKQIQVTPANQLAALLSESLVSWMQLTDDILGNGDSAVDVLNDLLNYDKIESGTLRLEFSSVAIWSLVKKTAAAFVMQAKQKSIDLQLVGDCWSTDLSEAQSEVYENLRVVGDVTRIAQVLRNLISNALKFTPEAGSVILKVEWVASALPDAVISVPLDQIELLEEPRAGAIRISVTDSGAGLSPDQLAQICTEGMQFNANQLQAGQGSGLGLYISKGLAEQHGGGLTVTSEGLGKGATFIFDLPLFMYEPEMTAFDSVRPKPSFYASRKNRSRDSSRKVAPMAGKSMSRDGSSFLPEDAVSVIPELEEPPRAARILVVDDAVSNRKLLMRILKAKGYECDGAEDGQQAVDLYISLRRQGEIVDAILMDFEMPIMDGPTATKRIRDLGCNCFIVGVTGNVLPADIDHFRSQGANAVLAKPLNVDVFESMMTVFRSVPDESTRDLHAALFLAEAEEDSATLKLHSLDMV